MALELPWPSCRDVLDPLWVQDPPALPAAPPKHSAHRGDTAQPQERGLLHQGIPSLIKVPSKGEESPSLYWCEMGSQSGPAPRMQGSLEKGGSFVGAARGPNT